MKRTILFFILLLASTLHAATRKVQYVDTDVVGGLGDGSSWVNAYAIMSTWAAQNTNLVAANNYLDVYFRGTAADTTTVQIGFGWTTSATCYINLQIDPNNYHDGVWSDSCYHLTPGANNGVYTYTSNVTFNGLQISFSGNSKRAIIANSTTNVLVENCILLNGGGDAATANICFANGTGALNVIRNNICVINAQSIGINITSSTGTADNNTIVYTLSTGTPIGILINTGANAVTLRNNLIQMNGRGSAYLTNGWTGALTSATNYTSDATSPDAGCGNATITFVGAANFHLDPTMSGTLAGTDLSGTFTEDIDGDTRSDWYAGADELLASSSNVNNWWWRRRNP